MYFKSTMRYNPAIDTSCGYYRLVECYRNADDRICHRTMLNIGFISHLLPAQLHIIQQQLTLRAEGKISLFTEEDPVVLMHVEKYWAELVAKKCIDLTGQTASLAKQLIDVATVEHNDVREAGAEWMGYQALEQLGLPSFFNSLGWSEEQIQLSLTQIVSRALYPYSELRTTRLIADNSAICELTGYPLEKITKDKLYQNALRLYEIKDKLEQHLCTRTSELFDIVDKIILYDLTNTYFEGEKHSSKLAQYGRSKEKRNDAKLIVLALVINPEGFIKYSNVFEGNTADSTCLPDMIDRLRIKTSETTAKALVVLDAGIATKENLELITAKGYDYVCVRRSQLKGYQAVAGKEARVVTTRGGQQLSVQQVAADNQTGYYLKVKSPGKVLKETGMKNRFETLFEAALQKLQAGLSKKGCTKNADKILLGIGRIKEKYPSVAKYYNIEVIRDSKGMATQINYHKNEQAYRAVKDSLGVYFIQTNLPISDEQVVWNIYNTIREIESTFRTIKTDLDLRPIYHKNDNATMAHLHLGLLAYWLVNTITYQLKQKNIKHGWQEIVRIGSTQKIITTTGKNQQNQTIAIRKCSQPATQLIALYHALNYKHYPFIKRKSVVHKTLPKKTEIIDNQQSPP